MKEIAKNLLKIKAVSLSPEQPFTWASGIKSPIYCDNRLVLSYIEERAAVIREMIRIIKEKFPECESLMGTATAGIPHASICAWEMGLPTGYIRSKAKEHGKGKQIEGYYYPGMKVVVVEDLISTGGSSLQAVEAAREAGCEVLGLVAIFTYSLEKAKQAFAEAGVTYYTLSNYEELVEAAIEENYIEESSLRKLQKFQKNPSDMSWMD
ncbi:orotate phosphoribosyltransferase [Lachnospiraceae bacterium oral taxon 500]|nr:orotate phosphoribosyltransferase [Lachnospiraceae bacterium oral taxon 500]